MAALEKLIRNAADHATAVMCAEAVPWQCHRNLLADALLLRGTNVIHIMGAGQTRPHELHEAARKDERGRVIYPANGQQIELI